MNKLFVVRIKDTLTVGDFSKTTATINTDLPWAEQLSAAYLLAASPQLLKGLKLAVKEFERIAYQKKCSPGLLDALKTAIDKAEGHYE